MRSGKGSDSREGNVCEKWRKTKESEGEDTGKENMGGGMEDGGDRISDPEQ